MNTPPSTGSSVFPIRAETTTVNQFSIESLRFLDEEGEPTQSLPPWAEEAEVLVALYRGMVFNRVFDLKAISLQRTGQLGTYASTLGQEAIGVGLGSAMRPGDVLLPSYREFGTMFWRGVSMADILRYWSGDERGMDFGGSCPYDFPITVTIGAQTTMATGVAYALKLRGEGQAAVCSLGDGATSKGDFYEAINAAGVWRLPLVFLVSNNHFAISMPASRQTAAESFAQKAVAAGVPALQIDGNDILAVRQALDDALDYTRSGKGALLIEAMTYRLHDHTTADDASRYRRKEDLESAWRREPIVRFRKFLFSQGCWDDTREKALQEEAKQAVQVQVDEYLATPPANPANLMFDHLYAELPKALERQRKIVEEMKGGDDHA